MSQKHYFLPHAEPTLKKLNCVIYEVVFFRNRDFGIIAIHFPWFQAFSWNLKFR